MSLVRNDAAGGAENAGETPSTAARSPSLRKGGESGLSYERAANEVIADACEMVLNNEKMLARLEKDNAKLARSFRDYMRSFLRKIRKAFTGAEATHAEAKAMQGVMRDLAKVWSTGVFGEGEAATQANENAARTDGGKLAVKEIVDQDGKNYGKGVLLDTDLFQGVSPRNWSKVLGPYVYNKMSGLKLTMYDDKGNPENVYTARINDYVRKGSAERPHKVLSELAYSGGNNIRALTTVHLSEALTASKPEEKITDDNSHEWLDEYGWIKRHVIVQDIFGKIYDAELNIANGRRGLIAYSVGKIRRLDNASGTSNGKTAGPTQNVKSSGDSISEGKLSVKEESTRFSLKDEGAVTDRELLANTLASVAKNPASPTSRKAHDYP